MLLRGCREPTPYTAPAAPAPCGDGQKFHSGRACPRGGGQWGRAVGAYTIRGAAVRWVETPYGLRCIRVQVGLDSVLLSYLWCQGVFLFFEFFGVLSFLSFFEFFEFFEFWGDRSAPGGAPSLGVVDHSLETSMVMVTATASAGG